MKLCDAPNQSSRLVATDAEEGIPLGHGADVIAIHRAEPPQLNGFRSGSVDDDRPKHSLTAGYARLS
jgi:hypothetical protein